MQVRVLGARTCPAGGALLGPATEVCLQGWRKSMEDAHVATTDLGNTKGAAMFGVFDGHGGRRACSAVQATGGRHAQAASCTLLHPVTDWPRVGV